MHFTFEWIRQTAVVYTNEFKNKWLEFYNCSINKNIFYHPEIAITWLKHKDAELNIEPLFCIARYENLNIFYPLIKIYQKKIVTVTKIVALGSDDFDYLEPLYNIDIKTDIKKKFWKELFTEISKECNTLEIRGLNNYFLNESINLKQEELSPCLINNCTDFNQYLTTVNKKVLIDIKRQFNRLEKLGTLNFHFIKEMSAESTTNSIDKFLEAHAQRWQHTLINNNLYKNLIINGLKNNVVIFSKLTLADEDISWCWLFFNESTMYYYMPAINVDFATYSPGKLLIYYLLQYFFEHNYKKMDFMRGDEDYKKIWVNQVDKLYRYFWANPSLASKVKRRVFNTL